ncbi:PD-(D/E)XK nuclease family protein [Haloferax sp. YSSS75]|uniref:PD-(D/E)XK nuclease family protein n=1 Tax=Haloferax sp. YSSS75 TaxID=3388564 RepID=UPI00398CE9B9
MPSQSEPVSEKVSEFQSYIRPAEEPHRTIPEIMGRETRERTWHDLLAYFLRPTNGHGLGTDPLAAFLKTVKATTSIDSLEGDLETVRVDTEVQTGDEDRVDIFLTQEEQWFLCLELKVHSSEHVGQTDAYVETEYIGTRSKADYPTDSHHYLYLTIDDTDTPTATEFEQLTWDRLLNAWETLLPEYMDSGRYPNRGVAQFAEFLALVRTEVGDPLEGLETYYTDVQAAKRAHEELARALADGLKTGVRQLSSERQALRIRTKSGRFPQFTEGKYNRIEIDKPPWQAGRPKPTVCIELNFHLRPHLGPGEVQHRPSVAVNLDIRGGSNLKQDLRSAFNNRVDKSEYRPMGFGEPHTNTKWHFLTTEVVLDEVDDPTEAVLEKFKILYGFETEIDEIATTVPEP